MKYSSPSAVCFDFDGTVVRADDLILEATKRGFSASDLPEPTDKQVFDTVGLTLEEVVLHVLPDLPTNAVGDAVKNILDAFRQVREETGGEQNLQPIKGFLEFVDTANRAAVPLGIVSSKPAHSLAYAVESLGLRSAFKQIISTEHYYPKPNPLALIEFFSRVDVPCSQGLYIGDSVTDSEMAHNAGVEFWGAGWGYSGASKLKESGVSCVFEKSL